MSYVAQFFSRSTARVNLDILPVEALTTAWFLNFVNDWFDAMNERKKLLSFSARYSRYSGNDRDVRYA